jgi:thiol-disulfide isomerase/thioredoxin
MLKMFEGKPVFLDLWAPWCEPCKEEFAYSDSLYTELAKKKIELLYVSLNSNVTEADWKSNLQKFKLRGYHIMASKELEGAITTFIWGHPGGFSIPHYLLFDSNGDLLLKDALPPSKTTKLYDQIRFRLAL